MNIVELYKNAVKFANEQTFEKFKVHGPYEPGSVEHDFWLSKLDEFTAKNLVL